MDNENLNSTPTMKIGEVARASGIGIQALRFYEQSGLLSKPARTRSGYRIYRKSVLERLEFIKKAQTLGFSLDEIKRIIEENLAGICPCAEVRENVRQRLKEVDERLRDMRRYRSELAETLVKWEEQEDDSGGGTCRLIENSQVKTRQILADSIPAKGKRRKGFQVS